jgi:hypothetical protein
MMFVSMTPFQTDLLCPSRNGDAVAPLHKSELWGISVIYTGHSTCQFWEEIQALFGTSPGCWLENETAYRYFFLQQLATTPSPVAHKPPLHDAGFQGIVDSDKAHPKVMGHKCPNDLYLLFGVFGV